MVCIPDANPQINPVHNKCILRLFGVNLSFGMTIDKQNIEYNCSEVKRVLNLE